MVNGAIELDMPSSPRYVSLARLITSSLARGLNFSEEGVDDLKIVISEMCTNAIIHCDLERGEAGRANVKYIPGKDCITIEVQDHGQGSDPGYVGDFEDGLGGGQGVRHTADQEPGGRVRARVQRGPGHHHPRDQVRTIRIGLGLKESIPHLRGPRSRCLFTIRLKCRGLRSMDETEGCSRRCARRWSGSRSWPAASGTPGCSRSCAKSPPSLRPSPTWCVRPTRTTPAHRRQPDHQPALHGGVDDGVAGPAGARRSWRSARDRATRRPFWAGWHAGSSASRTGVPGACWLVSGSAPWVSIMSR